jgi:hypothetical protein
MGTAWIVGAIGFGAAVFMLGFLIALLREGAPSVCYWVVPVRRKSRRETLRILRAISISDDRVQERMPPATVVWNYSRRETGSFRPGRNL